MARPGGRGVSGKGLPACWDVAEVQWLETACRPAAMRACLRACLPARLPACAPACLPAAPARCGVLPARRGRRRRSRNGDGPRPAGRGRGTGSAIRDDRHAGAVGRGVSDEGAVPEWWAGIDGLEMDIEHRGAESGPRPGA